MLSIFLKEKKKRGFPFDILYRGRNGSPEPEQPSLPKRERRKRRTIEEGKQKTIVQPNPSRKEGVYVSSECE